MKYKRRKIAETTRVTKITTRVPEDKRQSPVIWMRINGITDTTMILAMYPVSMSVATPQPVHVRF